MIYISLKDAAKMLNMPLACVEALVKTKILKSSDKGIDLISVEKYLKDRQK